MRRSVRYGIGAMFAIVASALFSPNALGCPVCYGAADSPMIDGMNAAILTLVGITGMVLAGISTFFLYLIKRIRAQRRGESHGSTSASSVEPVVNEKGVLRWSNS